MEIHLNLSRHCIQTAARLKLEHLIRQCLKAPEQETEEMIEALTDFLSQNDFGKLRRRIDLARKSLGNDPALLVPLDLPDDMLKPFFRMAIGPDSCLLSMPLDSPLT
ncbi:hypothetical protein DO021_03165 [Desulfobacter hydrogenophilus]|uniref:Uncharacterized protein n=1 Tax=Desulfobacter hydrogenophilus TaxID=2291 RepID=A0A328FJ48_9BACT|nr:hypothetical protein [Desulfobacter hydrogenophilus]NDY71416.1 hypothetical protein [Desulfobacter hydrogenophilus]QBH12155.1 hypothetical protein EYB58_03960 [Desulfobacter hydrogenophilus]RAM03522.1 hypothetical protein DO021_03165 [Desulfobacter hydrogenophilus]